MDVVGWSDKSDYSDYSDWSDGVDGVDYSSIWGGVGGGWNVCLFRDRLLEGRVIIDLSKYNLFWLLCNILYLCSPILKGVFI